MKKSVLFVCIHNSARSQMAEAFLIKYGGTTFEAESAGLEDGVLNPIVVDAMKEVGIDISKNQTKRVLDFFRQGKHFDYVITVCDAASGKRCPAFPGGAVRLHWEFEDPSSFRGTYREKLGMVRVLRDRIEQQILAFLREA